MATPALHFWVPVVLAILALPLAGAEPAASSATAVAASSATEAAPAVDPAANAALEFWRAIVLIPGDSDPVWTATIHPGLTGVDTTTAATVTAATDALFAKPVPALDLLALGSVKPYCDWGIDYGVEGMRAPVPQLDRLRRVNRLLCLRAEWHARRGDGADAVADLVTGMRVGRISGGRQPLLIDSLVTISEEAVAIQTAARILPLLTPADRHHLGDAIAALPAPPGLADALDNEMHVITGIVAALRALPIEQRKHRYAAEFGQDSPTTDMMPDDDLLDGFLTTYPVETARWTAWMRLPVAARLQPLTPRFSHGDTADNPLVNGMGPAIEVISGSEIRMIVTREMLVASIDLFDGVPDRHPDPITGKAFTKTTVAHGFTLSTTVPGNKKVIVLVIGEATHAELRDVNDPQPSATKPADF